MSDFLLSPKYRLSDWKALAFQNENDWLRAIDIVEDRIKGRFVRWIDEMVSKPFSGFAVLALDCLLLETLFGFQQGVSTKDTWAAYKGILAGSKQFAFDVNMARSFYENVRHGIVHDTETRKGWLVEQTTPVGKIVERDAGGNHTLNRTLFHNALKEVLDNWLSLLRRGDQAARENMRRRMEEIIQKSV